MVNGKAKTIAVWALSVLLALTFVGSGGSKLADPAQFGAIFVHWGYPAWFALVTGAIEVIGGLLLLVPRVAAYAAGLLAVVMAGAAVTHLKTAGEAPHAAVPLILLTLALVIAVARWRRGSDRQLSNA